MHTEEKETDTAKEAKISRLLSEETIRLELNRPLEWEELLALNSGDESVLPPIQERREQIIEELVEVVTPSGKIQHTTKILGDLIFREKSAPTALGHGIAVPHVRTIHARDVAIGFARTRYPVDWGALDNQPVDLFFIMVTPPYDDKIYHKLWAKFAMILSFEGVIERLRQAEEPGEILRIMRDSE